MSVEETTAEQLGHLLAQATADAFTAYTTTAQQAREDLYALTMSGLGGCTRQAAYRVARTPPSQELVFRQMREANIGTMIHEGLLPHMALLLGGRDEVPVELTVGALTIKGRTDLYSERLKTVADLKTVGQFKFAALGGGDVNRSHRLQVSGYAYAIVQQGDKVEWIAWVYVDRSSGAEHVVVEPFTDELIALVEQRCADLELYGRDPEAAPRDERGPGLSYVCDSCPWLKTCWGDDAEAGTVGAQRILAQDHGGVERALALYDAARAREKEAISEKEFAKAMFASYEPGNYGTYSFAWSSTGDSPDKDAAVELLASAGIPVPRKRTTRRLVVRRSK